MQLDQDWGNTARKAVSIIQASCHNSFPGTKALPGTSVSKCLLEPYPNKYTTDIQPGSIQGKHDSGKNLLLIGRIADIPTKMGCWG